MQIVMDFRKYDGVIGGVERGVIEITKYVTTQSQGHQVILLCKQNRHAEIKELFENSPNITILPLPVLTHVMSAKNIWMDSKTIQDIAEQENADIIHFPYNWSFPLRKKVPSILTVHDVIPFTFREAMGLFRNLLLYKPGIRQACRANNMIATVSEFSKQDIAKKVGVPPEKIRVIPNGLREPSKPDREIDADLNARFGLQDGFILNVGGIHERKNIPRLIHSFARHVNQERYTGKLLITGNISGAPYQTKTKKICDAAVEDTGMEDQIVFTGFISDEKSDSLIRRAVLLIYPSLYEGFGIPILEAMKVGTPVITSNLTAMPEVAGGAALLIYPFNTEEMTTEMSRLLKDDKLREELIRKGFTRSSSYSWKRTAEQYLELYKQAQ
ncbi:MAG: glycosyltransferase family 4 protein [Anaerolineales bacterium]|nr:glycosyltransferase family 4 protein [Anaerolineales bacterium]